MPDNSSEYDNLNPKCNLSSTPQTSPGAISSHSNSYFDQLYISPSEGPFIRTSSQENMPAHTASYQSAATAAIPQSAYTLSTSPNSTATVAGFDLQDVIHQFRTQPELLHLILNSKVEEDRRRAEEAKLRGKEIDFYLQRKQQESTLFEKRSPKVGEVLAPIHVNRRELPEETSHTTIYHSDPYTKHQANRTLAMPTSRSQGFIAGVRAQPSSPRRHSAFEALQSTSPTSADRRMGIMNASEEDHYIRNRSSHENSPRQSSNSPRSPDLDFIMDDDTNISNGNSHIEKKRRKRREMQAVTTIVETRDPYNDDYMWKNNGNTLHKKTGQKSTYYKCSNSSKGCPVNKTVTLRENDTYLIKYRGEHLPECYRVKRIVDI
ncbi:hypothetical protein BGW37DRAFT_476524 [Umbelopsis sp. PMI_123]|nr:hypothetical protein BGW37DRAFT_476524 [Umbelopsis sp. PMI_123]